MTYEQFDVVVVPFPFTDKASIKRRPAIVISNSVDYHKGSRNIVLAMVTSARHSHWPLDCEIFDLDSAGLSSESIIRMKLFTLDQSLVLRKIGILSGKDRQNLRSNLQELFD